MDDNKLFIIRHAGDMSIQQIAKVLHTTTHEVLTIYDEVYMIPPPRRVPPEQIKHKMVLNVNTGEVTSASKIAKIVGLDANTIRVHIRKGDLINGITYKYIEDSEVDTVGASNQANI